MNVVNIGWDVMEIFNRSLGASDCVGVGVWIDTTHTLLCANVRAPLEKYIMSIWGIKIDLFSKLNKITDKKLQLQLQIKNIQESGCPTESEPLGQMCPQFSGVDLR